MIKIIKNLIFKLKFNNNGFTLIEAIITVAIVGIIVAPISMVFIGSMNDTLVAKQQLKANQMAQLYVENLKSRTYEDMILLFPSESSVITLTETTIEDNHYLTGFPKIPDNYRVELSVDRSIYENISDYSVSKPANEISKTDADIFVSIEYSPSNLPIMYFYHFSDLENSFHSQLIDTGEGEVTYEYDFVFEHDLSQDHLSIDQVFPVVAETRIDDIFIDPDPEHKIDLNTSNHDVIVISVLVEKEDAPNANIIFNMHEMANTTCSAFIIRDDKDFLEPLIENQNGLVETNYNLMLANPADYFMSKIVVDVYNDSTNELLATISASVLYD